MLTIEERVKRIEDELGLTAKYEEKEHRTTLKQLAIRVGFSAKKAKDLAWVHDDLSEQQFLHFLQYLLR